jgi:hypothetical protein
MGVRAVHRMAAISCVRRVTRAATIGVANVEIMAHVVATEMAEMALSGSQERGDHQECAREYRAAYKHEG